MPRRVRSHITIISPYADSDVDRAERTDAHAGSRATARKGVSVCMSVCMPVSVCVTRRRSPKGLPASAGSDVGAVFLQAACPTT